jgi:hypothetical protein
VRFPFHVLISGVDPTVLWTGAGGIIGSASGGFLSNLDRKFPDVFGPDSLPGRFPYLAPMLLVAIMNIVGLVLGCVLLPEVRPGTCCRKPTATAASPAVELTDAAEDETGPVAASAPTADKADDFHTHLAGELPADALADAATAQVNERRVSLERQQGAAVPLGGAGQAADAYAQLDNPAVWVPPVSILRNRCGSCGGRHTGNKSSSTRGMELMCRW